MGSVPSLLHVRVVKGLRRAASIAVNFPQESKVRSMGP